MSITCKFLKKVTLIPGIDSWIATEWAHTFLIQLDLINWDFSGKLITNRESKFLSCFWIAFFYKLNISLFYTIAYHLQTDGLSELTNQTIEIALQFFVYTLENLSLWPKLLSHIQSLFNNIFLSTNGQTSNKVAYKFLPRQLLNL